MASKIVKNEDHLDAIILATRLYSAYANTCEAHATEPTLERYASMHRYAGGAVDMLCAIEEYERQRSVVADWPFRESIARLATWVRAVTEEVNRPAVFNEADIFHAHSLGVAL